VSGVQNIPAFAAELRNEIQKLHHSTSDAQWAARLTEFKRKYAIHKRLLDYLEKEWFTGKFDTWQVYGVPAGI
jgi:hypothetical protein